MMRSRLKTTPIGEIVRYDFRAAAILDQHHLDYCCGGAQTLAEGCRQRGLDVERVVQEIEALNPPPPAPENEPVTLIGHIVEHHHGYIRNTAPRIQHHLAKVVAAHGARHPELSTIQATFSTMLQDLMQHMMKEEAVLFPHIIALADAVDSNGPPPADIFGTVQNPIRMMEIEHQEADAGMDHIRRLSRDYRVPDDGCSTYRLVFEELEEFERDLQQHVDLENNILFPAAVELEEKARLIGGLKSDRWERQSSDR